MSFLEILATKYPKTYAAAKKTSRDSYGNLVALGRLSPAKAKLEAEKLAVYRTLTSSGPDLDWSRIWRVVRAVRGKVARKDILRAFETEKLEEALRALGYFGRKSDELRDPADRFYA